MISEVEVHEAVFIPQLSVTTAAKLAFFYHIRTQKVSQK